MIDMKTEGKLEDVYFFLLERTVRRFRKFGQREFSKRGIDLSSEQWVVMKRVHETPGITQKEIAESTYKDPASVTRMIDLLEKKGLLVRGVEKGDRRAFSISLTKDGMKYVEEILPLAEEMRRFGLKSVSNSDKAVFIKVLNKIYENLE